MMAHWIGCWNASPTCAAAAVPFKASLQYSVSCKEPPAAAQITCQSSHTQGQIGESVESQPCHPTRDSAAGPSELQSTQWSLPRLSLGLPALIPSLLWLLLSRALLHHHGTISQHSSGNPICNIKGPQPAGRGAGFKFRKYGFDGSSTAIVSSGPPKLGILECIPERMARRETPHCNSQRTLTLWKS